MEELSKVGKIMVEICDNEEQASKFVDALNIVIDGTTTQVFDGIYERFAEIAMFIKQGNNKPDWIKAFTEHKNGGSNV